MQKIKPANTLRSLTPCWGEGSKAERKVCKETQPTPAIPVTLVEVPDTLAPSGTDKPPSQHQLEERQAAHLQVLTK